MEEKTKVGSALNPIEPKSNANCLTQERVEELAEEEMSLDIDKFQDDNEIIDIIDEYVHRLKDNECQINLPEGYQFTDENGNVINTTKIVLEKKKNEYPKTYEECCEILEDVADCSLSCFACGVLNNLQKLLLCRAAYWKIAGEEMGLETPWEPPYGCEPIDTFCLQVYQNRITKVKDNSSNHCILTFSTEEMRDAFYENFKEEIEICKELL